jgi:hypothetical protein
MARLTRAQVAARLGVSVATVRRMEGRELRPVQEGGVWTFDPVEVAEAIAGRPQRGPGTNGQPARSGDVAATVFRLLDEGHGFREIVRFTRQHPDVVRALYRDWYSGFDAPDEDAAVSVREAEERELRQWEADMRELTRREDDYELRSRATRNTRAAAGRTASS